MKLNRRSARVVASALIVSAALLAFTVNVRVLPGAELRVEIGAPAAAFDPVKWVWEKFRDGVLNKVLDFIKKPIEAAKNGLKALIDKALSGLKALLESKVLIPALVWALPKIFPSADKFFKYVQQIAGKAEMLMATAEKYAAVVDAFVQKNAQKMQQAIGESGSTMDLIQKFNVSMIVDILMNVAREKLLPFIKSKTIDLLNMAFGLIEGPIELGKAAACSAIGSIPIVGGILRGAADFIITEGLKLLRQKGFEFVADKAAELAGKVLDAIGNQLKGLAAKVDDKIAPILDKVKGFLAEAAKYIGPIKEAWAKAKDVLGQLAKPGSFDNVVQAAGSEMATRLFDEFIKILRNNAPAAKAKLQELADKLSAVLPAVKAIAVPVVAGIDAGASAFVDEAAKCRDRITGINKESAQGVFDCLKTAFTSAAKVAGVEALRSLYDEFINLLRTNAPAAKAKLQSLADKLVAVFPASKAIADPVLAGINAGSSAFADNAAKCRDQITGLNQESAQGVFGCLKTAFTSALKTAGVEALRSLFDEFAGLIKSNCGKAASKLSELIGKISAVIPQARDLSDTVLTALNNGCNGIVEKVTNLAPIR
jgi:ElaB/YqjD/DUF883 family membrane-anchored ribosome-binding protein